jgi:pilus assembly protein CpaD
MDVVADAGLPPDAVTPVRGRRNEAGYAPAIRIAYERAVAVAPECGDWPENLAENRERIHYANFGCTTQRNLALTVANARDLQHPQFETPAAGERRTVVWSKYAGAPQSGSLPPAGPATTTPVAPPGGNPPRTP